jgi:hypothetical protein
MTRNDLNDPDDPDYPDRRRAVPTTWRELRRALTWTQWLRLGLLVSVVVLELAGGLVALVWILVQAGTSPMWTLPPAPGSR